ncbi:hypothetical protein CAEBREN_25511 [Caenorhabditis brenneri]|uniref:Uncharacterized protein n=1 Tax=Caenorhabditis brenneri TaxID=135651 RepID=G0M779_CAEBE|nr:hypothetical protein CAEBREN_25511 [Caenorhabditis brenneri]
MQKSKAQTIEKIESAKEAEQK